MRPIYDNVSIFFKMAAVRHLGFVMCVFGPPVNGIWWSLWLCKIYLVGIDDVVLMICMFSDFTSLAWKRLFTWGILTNKWGAMSTKPKKVHTCASPRRLSHHASTRLTCKSVPEKRAINKNKLGYISPIRPETPKGGYAPNLARSAIGVADGIACDNFFGNRLRGAIL